jgi:hypothetical protein
LHDLPDPWFVRPMTPPEVDQKGSAPVPRSTISTPDDSRGGLLEGVNIVTALLRYRTESLLVTPPSARDIVIGSKRGDADIVIESPNVSRRHARLQRKGRKGELLYLIDLKSKNGTYVDGEKVGEFVLRPGQVFTIGTREHRFLCLNEQMRRNLPALRDILGTEIEFEGRDPDDPEDGCSPSQLIVLAVSGAPLVIIGPPGCEQRRLAALVHEMSRFREREPMTCTPTELPADGRSRLRMRDLATRSTFVLDLTVEGPPIDPSFIELLTKPRYQVRMIVLAPSRHVATQALGVLYAERLRRIQLHSLAERPAAIDHLLDRSFEEIHSPLHMSLFTSENQEALRNYAWPKNFDDLRKAATRLTAIYREGSMRQAASALDLHPSTLNEWYRVLLKLSEPMRRSPIQRDKSAR